MIIKNYFGFGKDGISINGDIVATVSELNETSFTDLDKEYIETQEFITLQILGLRLEKDRNLVFNERTHKKPKPKRYYRYKGEKVTMDHLSEISGINYNTLYGRINRYKIPVEKAVINNK